MRRDKRTSFTRTSYHLSCYHQRLKHLFYWNSKRVMLPCPKTNKMLFYWNSKIITLSCPRINIILSCCIHARDMLTWLLNSEPSSLGVSMIRIWKKKVNHKKGRVACTYAHNHARVTKGLHYWSDVTSNRTKCQKAAGNPPLNVKPWWVHPSRVASWTKV